MSRTSDIDAADCLQLMGVDVWVPRQSGGESAASDLDARDNQSVDSDADIPVPTDTWDALQAAVARCERCGLHQSRTQTVFGVGNPNADLLVIGEAPGAEEDKRGEPFVGRAGKLLDSMLHAIGLSRSQVFIANILKCRPPNNRDPRPEEVAACQSYLAQQIASIEPKLILAVGRIAAQNLLNVTTPIGKMRGQRYAYGETDIPVLVTYHPAYLLRSPKEKRKAWQDLKQVMAALNTAAETSAG